MTQSKRGRGTNLASARVAKASPSGTDEHRGGGAEARANMMHAKRGTATFVSIVCARGPSVVVTTSAARASRSSDPEEDAEGLWRPKMGAVLLASPRTPSSPALGVRTAIEQVMFAPLLSSFALSFVALTDRFKLAIALLLHYILRNGLVLVAKINHPGPDSEAPWPSRSLSHASSIFVWARCTELYMPVPW
ncbi:hypothetical protein PsYK624_034350 [Phanerochaete sordida]|uniref:Uncharacterized protein n=1 Tax=Phanerochaete sordida TaxID=48140 RepID=A0A9P3G1M0_9APHY|nr:hypothetical protein PsYK624_034350 [Phanerochaete sordida]